MSAIRPEIGNGPAPAMGLENGSKPAADFRAQGAEAGAPKLVADHVGLSWDGQPVIADASLSVQAGSLLCLVGRSGCGKTTLFHAMAGLTEPDSGRVLLDGEDITGQPGRISYMLQKDLLLPQRTVLDNVCLPLLVRGVSKKQARVQAREHFARFGIEGTEKLYPSQLSGGMRQRAALLRTYLMDNDTVLMDEPFSALDALTRADMRQWFLAMMDELGLTSVLVTHDVDEAVALADEIAVLGSARPGFKLPSTVVGRIAVKAPRADRARFLLSEEALEVKRQVMALLDNEAVSDGLSAAADAADAR